MGFASSDATVGQNGSRNGERWPDRRALVDATREGARVNPFNVTEVYVKLDGAWKLGSLSFTRLLTPQERARQCARRASFSARRDDA